MSWAGSVDFEAVVGAGDGDADFVDSGRFLDTGVVISRLDIVGCGYAEPAEDEVAS